MSTFKRFSAAVCYVLLVCWSWEASASHLLTNTVSSGVLIDQQFDQNNEQNRYVISGFVVDAESAENLVGATVHASEMGIGTTTNRYGFFSLSVKADSVRLVISHVGYLLRILNQELTENLQLNIELQPETTGLDEIEVIAVGESTVEAIQMSQIKLPVQLSGHSLFWQEKQTSSRRFSCFPESSLVEKEPIESEKSWSYGGELFIRKSIGKVTGWIGYSLTKTQRKFPALNGGRTFPFRFDRLHDVSIAASWQLRPLMELSVVWVYGTGQAVWLPVGQFYGFQHDPGGSFNVFEPDKSRLLTTFGNRNSLRMRAYHRLDLSMQMKRDMRWSYRTFSFGVYNAYSRRNPFLLQTKNSFDEENGDDLNYLIFQEISAFPIIPFANYKLEF